MTITSPVPATTDAFKAALVTAFAAEPTVGIYDGPQRRENVSEYEVIQLGVGFPSAEETPTRGGLANRFFVSFPLRCSVWVWKGDKNYSTARLRCEAILETVRATLATNHTLSGVVMESAIGRRQWSQRTSGDGVAVVVFFTVDFRAAV